MSTTLFVGNLDYKMTEEELQDIFQEFGTVSNTKILKDRETNRSRGFGYVTFEDGKHAETAVQGINNTSVRGRTVRVEVSHPREEGGGGRGGGRSTERRDYRRDDGGYRSERGGYGDRREGGEREKRYRDDRPRYEGGERSYDRRRNDHSRD